MHLSELLGTPLASPNGDSVGRADDVIVRLRGPDYPLVTGIVAGVGKRRAFLPIEEVSELDKGRVVLKGTALDARSFERRDGEVLLRQDVLGHRLIDVAHAELVRAWDVELKKSDEGWVLSCLDTRRPARLLGLFRSGGRHACEDWHSFEPLIGHRASVVARGPFRRLRRLKPAQLADLLEDSSRLEESEILDAVHADPELEADVFEELDADTAARLLSSKTDADVAEVLAHMRADDAADAIADLPQERRQEVLDLLPTGARSRVLTLMGFHATSAGGLMNPEYLSCPKDSNVEGALRRVRSASHVEPQAQTTVHAISSSGRLLGVVSVIDLLHADPDAALSDVMDSDPVRVVPSADVVDVALLMADYNLLAIPVVDAGNHILGVVTVDDILEATIPEEWRRREPLPRPALDDSEDADEEPPVPPTAIHTLG